MPDALPSNEGAPKPSVVRSNSDNTLKIIIAVLLVLVCILGAALGTSYLKPQTDTPAPQISGTPPPTELPSSVLNPSLNPVLSQKGSLVDSIALLYTLAGRVTKIEPAGSNYHITVHSRDGSQSYILKDVGGENVLYGAGRKALPWADLKTGDEVLVNLSLSTSDKLGPSKVTVTQILVSGQNL